MTPWTATYQALLSSTISWRLLKFTSIESVKLSNHLILCHPLLLLPSIFSSIRVFMVISIFYFWWLYCGYVRKASCSQEIWKYRKKYLVVKGHDASTGSEAKTTYSHGVRDGERKKEGKREKQRQNTVSLGTGHTGITQLLKLFCTVWNYMYIK